MHYTPYTILASTVKRKLMGKGVYICNRKQIFSVSRKEHYISKAVHKVPSGWGVGFEAVTAWRSSVVSLAAGRERQVSGCGCRYYNVHNSSFCWCLSCCAQLTLERRILLLKVCWKNNTARRTPTPWPESASELYRPSDHRLSAKIVSTFADRVCHVASVTDPYGHILGFLDWSRYFHVAPQLYLRGWVDPLPDPVLRKSDSAGKREHKKKLHGLSPRANYTDRATAACRRSDCQLLREHYEELIPFPFIVHDTTKTFYDLFF
jgi:hypothetical protein